MAAILNIRMIQIADVLSDVLAAKGLVGVPPNVATDAIRKAIIDFCDRTAIWEYTDWFTTQDNVNDYPIRTPEGTRLSSMKRVSIDGNPLRLGTSSDGLNFRAYGYGYRCIMEGAERLWVGPVQQSYGPCELPDSCGPCDVAEVEWTAALKPSQDACDFPDFIYQDWLDGIAANAAYRLFMIPKMDWSNAGLAQQGWREYMMVVGRARNKRVQNYSQGGLNMVGGYF